MHLILQLINRLKSKNKSSHSKEKHWVENYVVFLQAQTLAKLKDLLIFPFGIEFNLI